jgi:hypothetical protein
VLALTKSEGIQLSVCNEALGFRKPMVVSDTAILRSMFGRGSVLVDPHHSPEALQKAIVVALESRDSLTRQAADLCECRILEWNNVQLSRVLKLLASRG